MISQKCDFADDVEESRILIEKMIKKNVDFSVQLLIFLHCFSDVAGDVRDDKVSMLWTMDQGCLLLGVVLGLGSCLFCSCQGSCLLGPALLVCT